jgi:hypothetical protein
MAPSTTLWSELKVTFIKLETLNKENYETMNTIDMDIYLYGLAGSLACSSTTTVFSAALTARMQA